METGRLIAERFEIRRRTGVGAMGHVYRAWDQRSSRDVAIKVLVDPTEDAATRFRREATVLSEIDHRGVVGFVDQGMTPDGQLWLAMEWIEGETLTRRLASGALSLADAIAIGRGVARGVGAAHRRGLIHRDIKPSNLLLRAGSSDDVVVVDFGIVHLGVRRDATTTGAIIGTPGYMAPEQARGSHNLDARADVFSLGCVLFECLTGKPAFTADHLLAILAKILLEDTPRVRELRSDAPEAIDDLVAAMLAKTPDLRPANGDAVADELDAIATGSARTRILASPALTTGEQRILSVVLGAAPRLTDADSTFSMATSTDLADTIEKALPTGCRLERLADGTYLVALSGHASPRDQAAQAGRAALGLMRHIGDHVVIATGRGVLSGRLPVGEVIDRAVRLLRGASKGAAAVHVDELTAGLLDSSFHVRVDEHGFVLARERAPSDAARHVCGVSTTCVGRDRELRALSDLYAEARDESTARAALLVAPAGVGKSRLRQELLTAIGAGRVELLIGRGDPMRAGSPFALIAHALWWAMGLGEGEPIAVHHRRIAAHVARFFDGDDARRVTRYLGELVGVPSDDEDVGLVAARRDPQLMGDLCRRAWLDWLLAASRDRPVVIVLEDLQWADAGTVALIDATLRELVDRPLFVLALARPEVRDQFPRLWANRHVTEVPLGELPRKACERVVREVLGDVEPAVIARVVERAAGNPFFLEELIRATAAGQVALPDSVIATVQGRLEALPAPLRRTLRAGSVFGEVFSRAGLAALTNDDVDDAIAALVQAELVNRRSAPRVSDDPDFAFRHALVREAAYSMLTDADRALGHRLAGEWLERVNPADAIVLAEHFERGGNAPRAIQAYQRAAEQALAGNDFNSALQRADRGLRAGAKDHDRIALSLVKIEAHRWRGELAEAGALAMEALAHLPPGTTRWFRAVDAAIAASGRRADYGDVIVRAREVAAVARDTVSSEVDSARVVCLCEASRMLFHAGRYDLADELMACIDVLASDLERLEPGAVVQVHRLRAARARHVGDLAGDLAGYQAVLEAFTGCGDLRNACNARVSVGFAHLELGDTDRAGSELERALIDAERMWLDTVATRARQNLALVRARTGRLDDARVLAAQVIDESVARGDRRFEGWTRIYMSEIALTMNDLATAESEASLAVTIFAETPPARAGALAARARSRSARGRHEEALADARAAITILDEFGGIEEFESLVWLAAVEAATVAAPAEARALAARACRRLLDRAATLSDPEIRARFLERVPENALLLASCPSDAPSMQVAFDPEAFRATGHRVIDRLADYLDGALSERIRVHPSIAPAEMVVRWSNEFPDEPGAADLAALLDRVIEDSVHQHHPGHMGHQVTAPLPASALCDLVAALLNNGMAGYESGPAATAIEKVVVGELAKRLGYPTSADGLLTAGGSVGNLTALLAARQACAGFDVWEQGAGDRLAVLVSDQSHYSVARAARIMGLGTAGTITVASDERYRMRPEAVSGAITEAARNGRKVFAIVASACSTQTGSIDPLPELAALAEEHGAWLHVDGAHGASAVLTPRYRPLFAGIERADSVVWDAHKMMLQPALVTAVLFRRGRDARSAFAQNAAYLFAPGDPEREAYDLGLRTLECTKFMMGVKLYATFATVGARALGDYVASAFDLARAFARRLATESDFELICEPDTNIVCFRYLPHGVPPSEIDLVQRRVRARIVAAGNHAIVETKLRRGVVLRVVLTNPFTTEAHLASLIDAIRAA